MARPRKASTEAQIAAALEGIRSGKSVRQSCKDVGILESTFRAGVDRSEYEKARMMCADVHFDEILDLDEQCRAGEIPTDVFRAVIDARKWVLARMKPVSYGDKSAVDVTSAGGALQANTTAITYDISKLSPEAIAKAARALYRGETE